MQSRICTISDSRGRFGSWLQNYLRFRIKQKRASETAAAVQSSLAHAAFVEVPPTVCNSDVACAELVEALVTSIVAIGRSAC